MSSAKKYHGRKRNKKFYCKQSNSKKRKLDGLEPGLKGFLITCNDKKEAPTVSEAYTLLNEYADELYGPEETIQSEEDSGEDESIENALKKEINNLKDKSLERRFKSVKTKVKNVLFIKTTLPKPNEITDAIYTELEKTKIQKSRRILKFYPVMSTCYASLESIMSNARKMFEEFFHLNNQEATYCIVFKSRCNETVKRDDLIQEIAKIIQDLNEDWKVQYKNQDYTVIVDIIANVCTLGILKDFDRFRKYNLQSMTESNERDFKKENKEETKSTERNEEDNAEEEAENKDTKESEDKDNNDDKTKDKETRINETKENETKDCETKETEIKNNEIKDEEVCDKETIENNTAYNGPKDNKTMENQTKHSEIKDNEINDKEVKKNDTIENRIYEM